MSWHWRGCLDLPVLTPGLDLYAKDREAEHEQEDVHQWPHDHLHLPQNLITEHSAGKLTTDASVLSLS